MIQLANTIGQSNGEVKEDALPESTTQELDYSPGNGSLSEQEAFHDTYAYSHSPGFPVGVEDDSKTGFLQARTTFYAKEAPEQLRELFDRLWKIQHGGFAWGDNHYSPINEIKRGWRYDPAKRDNRLRCEAILDALELPYTTREQVAQRVLKTDLRGFSLRHGGIDGATLGFTLCEVYNDIEQAFEGSLWPSIDTACQIFGIDAYQLAVYVFEKFADDAEVADV